MSTSSLSASPTSPTHDVQPVATHCNIGGEETDPLTSQQHAALTMMLAGTSDAAIASAINVNRSTVFRWRTQSQPFKNLLQTHRHAFYDAAQDRLRALLLQAANELEQQLNPKQYHHEIRFRAANALLRLASLKHLAPAPPASGSA